MKNLIVSIGTCLLSCALFSCNENTMLEEVDNGGANPQTKSAIDASYYVQGDGTLCFRSVDDYFAVTDSLIKLTDQELSNWEESIGFVSYRSHVDKLIDEVEEAFNEDDNNKANLLLTDYSKYIYLDTDSIVKPYISSKTYQSITNKDGVFYLGDLKNVVNNTSIYAVEKGRSVSPKLSYVMTSNLRSLNDLVQYKEYDYVKNDGTKKVISSCSLVRNIALTDVQGNNHSCVQFQIFVDGKRHKRGWKHYTTGYSVKDITCRFKDIPLAVNPDQTLKSTGDYLLSHPGKDDADQAKSHTFVYNIGLSVKNYTNPIQHATCIHYKAMTWGTGAEGLGYNYCNGSYGIDENHKDKKCAEKVCSVHSNVHSGDN